MGFFSYFCKDKEKASLQRKKNGFTPSVSAPEKQRKDRFIFMENWFDCKVKYEKMAEDGLMKSVIESYLVSAFNITEAEKKLTLELKPYIRGEFEVTDIKKARIAEIMGEHLQEESHWYKMKLTYIILDESKGKEKKVVSNVIVKAHDIMHSIHVLEDGTRGSVADYTITAICESSYLDIIRNVAI